MELLEIIGSLDFKGLRVFGIIGKITKYCSF
jgi:hypothetical protein